MAYSKNRRLADLVATDGTMDAAKLKSGTVTQAHLHSSHGITTAHITEGSNKYYTDERVDDRSNSLLQDGTNISLTYDDSAGTLTVAATDTNTTYSAGTGLALSSTTFSLSHLGLQSLSDPNADRIAFWDDSAGAFAWLTIGSNLTVSGTTLSGVAAYGDSDVDSHLSGGTGVTYSSGAISIGQAVATSSNVTFANLTLSGNLTVNGTTSTVSSTNTTISDRLIELGNGTSGTPAHDMGLVFERGSSDNAFVGWDESADKFIVGTGTFTGASTGNLTISTGTLVANVEGALTGNASTATALATGRTIHGVSFDGSANIDLTEVIQDTVGAMFSSNTETRITATYEDSDGTIDLVAADQSYTLPLGTSSARGGFKIGYTESGKNYPVELSSEQMYVNVPWTDTNTTYSVGDGGLTQNNFTNTLKSKLDGIEASATADQSAAEILTAIKTVDGSGSGLDADLLDGVDSGLYLKSQTNNNGGWSQSNRNFSVRSGGDAAGLHFEESDGTFAWQIYGEGTNYGFLDGEWAAWDIKKVTNGALQIDVGSGLQNVATQNWVNAQGFVTSGVSLSANNTFTGSNSFSNVYNEFGNGVGSVSNDGSWHGRVNIAGTSHGRLDVKAVGDGIIGAIYAHNGHDGPRFGSLSNHPVDFMVNGSVKLRLDSNGKIYPGGDSARGYIGPVGTHSISMHSVRDITFDWDANYDHIAYHGLFSQNSAGTYTDSMCLKSFDDITMMLDSNNNDSASYFRITNNTNDGSGIIAYIGFDGTQPIWSMPSASTKMYFSGSSTAYGIGTGGHNYNTTYLDTCDSGTNGDVLELVYYSGAGVKVGASGGTKPIYASIMYDGNNTGYYVDPDSTSHLYRINNKDYMTYPTSNGAVSSEGGLSYAIYQESGGWSSPFPELQIGFHTGINMGGHSSYNGTRIFTNSDMATINHQFAGASNYQYKHNWMHTTTSGFYSSSGGGFHFQPSDTGSYGSADLIGSRGSYGGLLIEYGSVVIGMYDSGGNGGSYRQANSKWHHYFHVSNACLGVNGSSTSSSYGLYVTGAIYATGDIVGSSDERLKKNINTIECGLDKVLRMRGVTYEWKDKEATGLDENKSNNTNTTPVRMGVIAQEILDIVPEAVVYDKENDRYGVEYGHLTGLLIEAIKDLNAKVEDLERKLEEK